MKDPAFLLYSKDFYEGTRTMLPEERACLIDLMIYQHQNGAIPNDVKRIAMYCSGCSEATLQATLEAKFKLIDGFWYNLKMTTVIDDRKIFSIKQSENGKVGQFWKKAKAILNKKEFDELRKSLINKTKREIIDLIGDQEINEAMLKTMLEAMLKHLAIANAIAIEDENIKEDIDLFLMVFDNFRKLYPGTKRGNQTEFENFKKKHKDWNNALFKLKDSLLTQISNREEKLKKKQFVPEWKNLQTWINQRCWEEEINEQQPHKQESLYD